VGIDKDIPRMSNINIHTTPEDLLEIAIYRLITFHYHEDHSANGVEILESAILHVRNERPIEYDLYSSTVDAYLAEIGDTDAI
jgi:hypothetical protein